MQNKNPLFIIPKQNIHMPKCSACGKEVEAKKALFEKGAFFCSKACRKKPGKKAVCEGNVCRLE